MNSLNRLLRSSFKIRQLNLLIALDEYRSLSQVAEFLSISQPAVSKSLAEVEGMFGAKLFNRSTRGTAPTPEGELVIALARSVLAEFEKTSEELAYRVKGALRKIRIGVTGLTVPLLMSRTVALLKDASPQMMISVEEAAPATLMSRVRAGEIDIVLARLERGLITNDLWVEALYEDPINVVARAGHALIARKSLTWRDVADQPWVMSPTGSVMRIRFEEMFESINIPAPDDVIDCRSFLSILSLVRERGALALMGGKAATHFENLGLLNVLPLAFPLPLPPVGIIARADWVDTPAARLPLDIVRRAAHEPNTKEHNSLVK